MEQSESPRAPVLPLWFWLFAGLVAALGVGLAFDLLTPSRVGMLNDDGVYATTARALAMGQGYIHSFAPGLEPANRYPIGYPLLLAGLVRLIPTLDAQLLAMQVFSLICLAIFLAGSCWLLADGLRLRAGVALGIGALLATNPWLVRFGSQVMADLPYAAGSILALAAFGGLLRSDQSRRRAWLLLGVAMGLLVVVRYQGLALPLSLSLFLLFARRFRAGAWLAIGAVLPLVGWGGWLVWIALAHGGAYAEATRSGLFLAAMSPLERLAALMTSIRFLALKVVPGFYVAALAPPVSNDPLVVHPGMFEVVGGLLFTGLTLMGMFKAAVHDEYNFAKAALAYVGVSAFVIVFWNASFTFLGYSQGIRLALPLAPLLLYFGVRAVLERFADREYKHRLVGLLLGVATASGLMEHALNRSHPLVPPQRAQAYMRAFDYLRANTPGEAHIGSMLPAMVYLYTDRRGTTFPLADPMSFAAAVKANDLGYIFLLHGLYGYLADGRDPMDAFVLDINGRFPGALRRSYQDSAAGMEVWQVNQAVFGNR